MMVINGKKFTMLWTVLKYAYGIVPIVLGLDKFFFFIVDWNIYVSPLVAVYVPMIAVSHLLQIVGIVEVVAGIIVLSKWTRFGAYLVAAWVGVVIINLLTIGGFYDIIARDLVIVLGYCTLALLTEIKESARQQ